MSAFDKVTVHGQWSDGTTGAEGLYLFDADGTLATDGETAIVTPVVRGTLDNTGSLWDGVTVQTGVSLLASSNFPDGMLNWHLLLRIQGFPTIDMANVVVDFGLGAEQNILDILTANGWTPVVVDQ